MALSRRRARTTNTIWAGFVDAMTGLLLVLVFVLSIFMVAQYVLGNELQGLTAQLNSLAQALGLKEEELEEKRARERELELMVSNLSEEKTTLEAANVELREDAQNTLTLLAAANLAKGQVEDRLLSEEERNRILVAQAEALLAEQERLKSDAEELYRRLTAQVGELRKQLAEVQGLFEKAQAAKNLRIEELSSQLNTLLVDKLRLEEANSKLLRERAEAAEERARLEERERELLAEKNALLEEQARLLEERAAQLAFYESRFFGEIRKIMEGREGVRIEGDRFVFSSEVLFPTGASELSENGLKQVRDIAEIIKSASFVIPDNLEWIIRVDGHTDNVPVNPDAAFGDNWELSQLRALSVVRYMVEDLGIPPARLAAAGFGEYHPVDLGDTPEARAKNRRIEFKLTER